MSDKTENQKLFTITQEDGSNREVFENDLDDKSRPVAVDIQNALALQKAREAKLNEAFQEVRVNELTNAFISMQIEKLQGMLPPEVKIKK